MSKNSFDFLCEMEMEDTMFSSKNLIRFTKYKLKSNFINQKDIVKKKPVKTLVLETNKDLDIFETKEKDSLFWCFFVLMNGIDAYDQIGNQHFVEEKKLKFTFIEEIRAKKELLKMHKIKPLTELEDDLANKERISEKTFMALCIIYQINAFFVYKRQYYEIICNDENKHIPPLLYKTEKPLLYKLDLNTTSDKLDKYKQCYFKLPTLNFKMKSIASYNLNELQEMAIRLGIVLTTPSEKKKQTKKDIYELIITNF